MEFIMACMLWGQAITPSDQAKIDRYVEMCRETYETATECWSAVEKIDNEAFRKVKYSDVQYEWRIIGSCHEPPKKS